MNVVQGKRKRTAAARQNRDYLDFNRINPVGADSNPAQVLFDNKSNANDNSFTTVATRGNSVVRQSSTYLSITSGRGYAHGEVGIAYINIESPAMKLIQLSDDPWYTGLLMKIHIIDPCQIIVPHTIYDAKPETCDGKLIKFIREEFPKLSLTKVPRRHFNETDGMEMIKKYCSEKYNFAKEEVESKYYALSAASGLLKYLQFVHNVFFKENGLKLEVETKFAHMQIDIDTSKSLELLAQSNPNMVKSSFPSLFDVLNHCVTSLGKRTLRARILEPMCDITSISNIQDCIAELNRPECIDLGSSLVQILRCFNNVECLHKLVLIVPQDDNIRAAEVLMHQALHLKKCLQFVPTLQSRLAQLTSTIFQEISINLLDERYASMLNHIDSVINKNLLEYQKDSNSQLFQRVNCVQSGVNDLVDILRKSYNELTGQIETLVGEMSTKYGQVFKVNYTVRRGFHVILSMAHNSVTHDFPDELEIIEIKRKTCYLTTYKINMLNIRIRNVIEEITMQSNVVISAMLNGITKEIDAIYDLSGFTATLDIILSFAVVSNNDDYVCPLFGDEMRIVDAVHPLLELSIHRTVPMPNNIISTPEYNFFIITGPNMSGKTIYIKTIAVLQIMAQLGCFVPAKSALFRITDRLLSRVGYNDSIEKNLSTFMTEMINMEYILKNVTPNSLVIIDELCRSTNPKDGADLAWNMSEYLASVRGISNDGKYFMNNENGFETQTNDIDSSDVGTMQNGAASAVGRASTTTRSSTWKNSKLNVITAPFIFLTTHFHSITKLANSFFNVVNLSFSMEPIVTEDGDQPIKYDHRIQEGVTTTTSYGLTLAKTVPLPPDLLNQATEFNQNFTAGEDAESLYRNRHKRALSSFSRQIIRFNRTLACSIGRVDEVASVISAAINTTVSRRRHHLRRFAAHQDNLSEGSATTSTTMFGDQLKIDRILYNAYGDIMSLVRNADLNWMMHCNDEGNSDIFLNDVHIDAIISFLIEFAQEHRDGLIEALDNLSLLQKLPEPPTEVANNNDDIDPSVCNEESEPIFAENQDDDHVSDRSSIISVQRIIAAHPNVGTVAARNILPQTFPRDRPMSQVSASSERSIENASRMATNHSDVMTSKPPSDFQSHSNFSRKLLNSNQHTPSGLVWAPFIPSDFQTNFGSSSSYSTIENQSSSSSSSSESLEENPSNTHSTPNLQFEQFQPNDQIQTNDDFFGSFEPFMRTQSQNDLFAPSNNNDIFYSGMHSSRQDYVAPSTEPFEMTSPFLSETSSQTQRSRPNLSNIKKNAMMSRSRANLNPAPNPEPSSSSVNTAQFTLEPSTFCSSDSIRSDISSEPDKMKRKLPLIHKEKLKVGSVFGSTEHLFSTQSKSNAPNRAAPQSKLPATKTNAQNRINPRASDSNYTAALKRWKKIQAKINAGCNVNKTTTEQSGLSTSNHQHQQQQQQQQPQQQQQQQDYAKEMEIDEDFLPPPPPGFD